MKDYAKIKALASQILECIGDEPEGENPKLDSYSKEDQGAPDPAVMTPEIDSGPAKDKKKKDSSLALLASTLGSKFGKGGK